MRARRGAVRESADGGLIIELVATDAAAAYAWLAGCALGAEVELQEPKAAPYVKAAEPQKQRPLHDIISEGVMLPQLQAIVEQAERVAAAAKAPAQTIGMDGMDSMTQGAPQLPTKHLAIVRWAAALVSSASFQNWTELCQPRDPAVSSFDHAKGYLLYRCGVRHGFELPEALGPLRAIEAAYSAWYAQTHPPGGNAFAGVPPCELTA